MEEIRVKVGRIEDEKGKQGIEELCAVTNAAQKMEGVFFAYNWTVDPFLRVDTFVFIKKGTDWYGACIQGACLELKKAKWGDNGGNNVTIDCEAGEGEAVRLHLTLED